MDWKDEVVDAIVHKYIQKDSTVSFGTSKASEIFMKRMAIKAENEGLNIKVIPASINLAAIASSLGLKIASIDETEVDVAIEFADAADENLNFTKLDTLSLVRDKMIAQSAAELIVVCDMKNFGKIAKSRIPFEVTPFGWKRTLVQLSSLGNAQIRKNGEQIFKTETGNYLIDVEPDDVYSLEDVDYGARELPGVIETGLFIGYADRLLLHNGKLVVKSRMDYSKQ